MGGEKDGTEVSEALVQPQGKEEAAESEILEWNKNQTAGFTEGDDWRL